MWGGGNAQRVAKFHGYSCCSLCAVVSDVDTHIVGFLIITVTRSSPQWRSGCSTTTHIVLDLRSLILGSGVSCMIVQCITSQPTKVSCAQLTFCQHTTGWLKYEKGTFRSPGLRVSEASRICVIDSSPTDSY